MEKGEAVKPKAKDISTYITIHAWDDWRELFIDGKKVKFGHSIVDYDLAEILCDEAGFEFEYIWHDGEE